MKDILRSIIDVDGSITQAQLHANLRMLTHYKLGWERGEDQRIFEFCKSYFERYQELPAGNTIVSYFTSSIPGGDVEVLERYRSDIVPAVSHIRTGFEFELGKVLEHQHQQALQAIYRDASVIAMGGLEVMVRGKKTRLQGPQESINYVQEKTLALLVRPYNTKVSGRIRDPEEGQQVWNKYVQTRDHKDQTTGCYTGIERIDRVMRGHRRGQLWVHGAFPGQLKTSFACTWAYNQAVWYGGNTAYWTLEMPYEQIRLMLYVMHSSHRRWQGLGYDPLDYTKVRDGLLNPEEEMFFKQVVDDFVYNPEYAHIEVVNPDHRVGIEEVRLTTELIHKEMEVNLVVIDNGGNLLPPKGMRSNADMYECLNENVKLMKLMALHFNHNEGVPVLCLYHMNRAGHDDAAKNNGVYKMSAFANANEIERSADVLTTTFVDDQLRARGATVICNQKTRDNAVIAPFEAGVDYRIRRLYNTLPYGPGINVTNVGDAREQHILNIAQL